MDSSWHSPYVNLFLPQILYYLDHTKSIMSNKKRILRKRHCVNCLVIKRFKKGERGGGGVLVVIEELLCSSVHGNATQ